MHDRQHELAICLCGCWLVRHRSAETPLLLPVSDHSLSGLLVDKAGPAVLDADIAPAIEVFDHHGPLRADHGKEGPQQIVLLFRPRGAFPLWIHVVEIPLADLTCTPLHPTADEFPFLAVLHHQREEGLIFRGREPALSPLRFWGLHLLHGTQMNTGHSE